MWIPAGEGLIPGLASRGFKPEDVTDVFLTHLHADHCGGAVIRSGNGYGLAFPNALHHVSRSQWEWAVKNNLREADAFLEENIKPLKQSGRLNLVEEQGELFRDFDVRICYGHTPGLMIPLLKLDGHTVIYTGDLIPTVAHIPLIWNMSYDIESLRTIDEKNLILTEALENDYILLFQHDASVECCTVKMTPKGIRVKDTFRFSEIDSMYSPPNPLSTS